MPLTKKQRKDIDELISSNLPVVFFTFFFNFLYKKLTAYLEELQELKRFKEETFNLIKNLEAGIDEYRITTEKTEDNQTKKEFI